MPMPAMRTQVDLKHAYRLLNHGPTVLVSAAHGGRRNIMAAAWSMPLDFEPPKVAVVIDKSTYTRELVEAAGTFALCVPCAAQADLTYTLGSTSGRELAASGSDKFERHGLATVAGRATPLPLLEGCVAWLECRVLPQPELQRAHDLFLGEVLAAQADDRVFRHGRWHFDSAPESLRTLHHLSGGAFVMPAAQRQAVMLKP
jgi:flavin reductase (DIM6/NTAB) family NADH-FMN oxidoreductase RutF